MSLLASFQPRRTGWIIALRCLTNLDLFWTNYIFILDSFTQVFFVQLKDLPQYQAVASNMSGSTPKDLFEDITEELEKQVILD